MGYYTRYTIKVPTGDVEAFKLMLDREAGKGTWHAAHVDHENMTWYDHDENIVEAMKEASIARVELHGEGEETGDVWDKEYERLGDAVTIKKFKYRLVRDETPEVIQ